MSRELFSIRMRAARGGAHVSGAERITGPDGLAETAAALIVRARAHERGEPDSITVTVDSLEGRRIIRKAPLPVTTSEHDGHARGRDAALAALVACGVSEEAALGALRMITSGAATGGANMRGAMVIDAASGKRLEPDRSRGVRARAMDWEEAALCAIRDTLKERGLDRLQFTEALALATKAASAPGAVAELCISDDPGYVTGYVASRTNGYVRITPLKESGDPFGGRAFFVDASVFDMDGYLHYMREVPVLLSGELVFN